LPFSYKNANGIKPECARLLWVRKKTRFLRKKIYILSYDFVVIFGTVSWTKQRTYMEKPPFPINRGNGILGISLRKGRR
jgi:hypothetical protein